MDNRPFRGRLDDAGRGSGRPGSPPDAAAFLGRVYDAGAMPSALLRYFAVRPVTPTGDEAPGAVAGSVVSTSASARVLVLGPRIPKVGDDLVCHKVADRWVAQRGQVAPSNALVATVSGCFGLRLPGAVVACDQTGQAATTDAVGVARIDIPSAGTYTGTIGRDRFDGQTWSINFAGTGNVSMVRTLTAAPGFFCFCGCPVPFPSTLTLVDPVYGSIALTYTSSVRTWTAARLSNLVLGRDKDPPPENPDYRLACTVEKRLQTPIVYQLACDAGLQPRLNVLFAECQKTFPNPEPPTLTNALVDVDFAGWPLSPSGASAASTSHGCAPLDFSVEVTFANNGRILYPGGPHTFRVRET